MQTERVCPLCGRRCSAKNEIVLFSPAYPREKMQINGKHSAVTRQSHHLSFYEILQFIYSSRTLREKFLRKLFI